MKKKDDIQKYLENIFTVKEIREVYKSFSTKYLSTASVEDITSKGINKKLASDIVNIFKVRHASPPDIGAKLTSSEEVYQQVKDLSNLDHEEFHILYLSQSNNVVRRVLHSKCGLNSTLVDVRLIALGAIRYKASAVILAHNHPSGNISPSKADLSITEKIKNALKTLDILLLDHIIVANENPQRYTSLADEGLL